MASKQNCAPAALADSRRAKEMKEMRRCSLVAASCFAAAVVAWLVDRFLLETAAASLLLLAGGVYLAHAVRCKLLPQNESPSFEKDPAEQDRPTIRRPAVRRTDDRCSTAL